MEAAEPDTEEFLGALAVGDTGALADAVASPRLAELEDQVLDVRTRALVRIAALIALDAPPVAYASQVALAAEGGASSEDVAEVLRVIAPLVGAPKVVAAAPEVMLALGLSLPDPASKGVGE